MLAAAPARGAAQIGGTMTRPLFVLFLSAVFVSGIGTTASAQVAMSCNDVASLSTCDHHEPEALAILGPGFFQEVCNLSGGSWTNEPCPIKDAVGVCDDGSGSTWTYYAAGGAPYDEAAARKACAEIGGTFSVPKPPPQVKTCSDHAALSVCSENTPEAVALLTEEVMVQICGLTDGVWSSKPCPVSSRVGSCSDGMGSTTFLYSDGGAPYDVNGAQQFCLEVGGTFTALAAPPPAQQAPTSARSCNDLATIGTCADFDPSAFSVLGEAVYREMCAESEGIWGADPCPTAHRVGSCGDGAGGTVHFYSVGGMTYDADTAASVCKDMMGIWTPVP